ncbi:MAG: polysaccharide deacetylase family protein [Deltaproteobacteria bacterium]|nr:polysaccharide deacetylase family protein [Deltaproteobacteria bacterium]
MPVLPVLMYHHVSPREGDMVTVTPRTFEAQMRHIKDAGYRTLALGEVLAFIEGRLDIKEKAVAVTFDDGYLDNYVYAFPALLSYGIKAAVFAVTGWVEKATEANASIDKEALIEEFKSKPPSHSETKLLIEKGFHNRAVVDWEMAEEMEESGLVEFHSHTVSHKSCDRITGGELLIELKGSKEALEARLKKPCDYLCWPKGRYVAKSVEMAKEAGYRGVFTTGHGIVKRGSDPFAIQRIVVKDKVQWLKSRLKVYTSPLISELYIRMKKA